MKPLTREEELMKQVALDVISNVTSARNPHRIEAMKQIITLFGPMSQDIVTNQNLKPHAEFSREMVV